MSAVTDHYDNLLAEHYTWMGGATPEARSAEQRQLLARLGVRSAALAVDLGAGPGFQSMALADIGFGRVLAFDTSGRLLEELRVNVADRPVQAIQDDMMNLPRHVAAGSVDAIVCMGDTLTHLVRHSLVPELFAAVADALRPGGRFILSYRDLSSELHGLTRFIPLRSSADRIMTCFLEFGADTVLVHDLIHVRDGTEWQLLKSCYPKLRLSVDDVQRRLEDAGFRIHVRESSRGMAVLSAAKITVSESQPPPESVR
ncbi:MAG: class I SAM-dependent methyltransferase [Steroidobacteraceae bacterium]